MKTSTATTHLLCLLAGFFLSNTPTHLHKSQETILKSQDPLIPIPDKYIPKKERGKFQLKEEIVLTKSHNGQPWCVFDIPAASIVSASPLWVRSNHKTAALWLKNLSRKTMVIPIKFKKNLPSCHATKPSVVWK